MGDPDPCKAESDAYESLTADVVKAQRALETDQEINSLDQDIKAIRAKGDGYKKAADKLADKRVRLAKPHLRAIHNLQERLPAAQAALERCREKNQESGGDEGGDPQEDEGAGWPGGR